MRQARHLSDNQVGIAPKMDQSGGDPYSNILECLNFWSAFSIDSLDQHAHKVAEYVEETVQERKKLAEETRKLNTLPDEEKVAQIKPLLKLYQKEVDRLTTRSKQSEGMFMTIFDLFTKAPDYNAAIAAAEEWHDKVRQATKLELENQKLQRELEEFHRDFHEVRNQEVTIRRLEDQLRKYEHDLERMVEEKVTEVERRMGDEMTAKLILQKEREDELTAQATKAADEARLARQNLELSQHQISNIEKRHESEIQAKQSQIDMLANEFERMTLRLETLEKENLVLKSGESHVDTEAAKMVPELEMQLFQKDVQIGELEKSLAEIKADTSANMQRLMEEATESTSQRDLAQKKVAELQKQLEQLPTFEEYGKMKARLQILKVLELDVDDEVSGTVPSAEVILKDRNRKLESENVKLRGNVVDLEDNLKKHAAEIATLKTDLTTKTALIQRLEEDLVHNQAAMASLASSSTSAESSDATGERMSSSSSADPSSPEAPKDLLSIVTAQRDRFRARVTALEEEVRSLGDQLKSAKVELRSVSDDNVKLYQRIKYMQSYGELSKGRGEKSDIEAGVPSQGSDRDVEDKYKQIYEVSVDPFAAFSRSERAKRVQSLNPAEKLVLDTSSFFLANRTTRMILFGYMLILHLLVFFSTWRLAHQSGPEDVRHTVADQLAANTGNNKN